MNKSDDYKALLATEILQIVMNNIPRHSGKNLDGLKIARSYLQEIEKELQLQIEKLEDRMWVVAAYQQGLFVEPPKDNHA